MLTRRDNSDGTTTLTGRCKATGASHSVSVPISGFRAWASGSSLVESFPELAEDELVFLSSGISPRGSFVLVGEG